MLKKVKLFRTKKKVKLCKNFNGLHIEVLLDK